MIGYEEKIQQPEGRIRLSFKTQKGEDINYTSLFNPTYSGNEYEAHNSEIREKINRPSDKYHRLGDLKSGEWASVENQYKETGMFDFTIRNSGKIQSSDDIAFIFRSLESETVEHAFAVYVDENKRPFVQWLSMGGVTGTLVDVKLLADSATRFDARDIYFVHNHPSGNLTASNGDRNVLGRLKKAFSSYNINVHGIILNLNSGHYSTFNDFSIEQDRRKPNFNSQEEHSSVPVYSFSKRAFLNSPLDTKITSSASVAKYLSQQRFASEQKRGYLLLNSSHHIIGNFFPTEKELNPSTKEAATLGSRYGATSMIVYGKGITQDAQWFTEFKRNLKNFDISVLDVVEVKNSKYVDKTYDYYISLSNEGLLFEPNEAENYNKSSKFQSLKDDLLKANWFNEEQIIADSLLDAIEKNDEKEVESYFKYGNNAIKIINNLNRYNHGLKFGFSKVEFNEFGWLENGYWANKEEVHFGKHFPYGQNAVMVGRGFNNKWAYSNQYSILNGGGGGVLSVYGEPFETKKEALNAGVKELEELHQRVIDNPYQGKKAVQVSKQVLDSLKSYQGKQKQMTLFGKPETEIKSSSMTTGNEKSFDLRIGGLYHTDSNLGGAFEVEYAGKNQKGEHLFENRSTYYGGGGKFYHVKPENVNDFITADLKKDYIEYLDNNIHSSTPKVPKEVSTKAKEIRQFLNEQLAANEVAFSYKLSRINDAYCLKAFPHFINKTFEEGKLTPLHERFLISGETRFDELSLQIREAYKNSSKNKQYLFKEEVSKNGISQDQSEEKKQIHEEPKLHDLKERNINFLSKQLMYLGFKDSTNNSLRTKVDKGEAAFNLIVKKEFSSDPINYTLHFDKSKQSDMYFLNSYKARLENGREQAVFLNKGKGFTAKETFNLMNGRAVFKQLKNKQDGTKYHAWIQLAKAQEGKNINESRNLRIYNENYGYNLIESLQQYPIQELDSPVEKQKLINSLQKGNRQAVTFKKAE